jgi:hypothetical protein
MFRKRSSIPLLICALSLQWLIRIAIWVLPYRKWCGLLAGGEPSSPTRPPLLSARQIAWSVAAASRLVPRSTCLVRAAAARVLLSWWGYPSQIRIGVARDPRFQSHAWLVCNGEILVGSFQPGAYTTLTTGVAR